MEYNNKFLVRFSAKSENEGFARICVSAFLTTLNPTVDELGDIKTAVSEAVTNSVVHAYPNNQYGDIEMFVGVNHNDVYIRIQDFGIGISDIDKAKQPFFTTKPSSERSGMGFTVMEGFMDELKVSSQIGFGTTVEMHKTIGECTKIVCGV